MPNPTISYEEKPLSGPVRGSDGITRCYGDYGHRTPGKVKGKQGVNWSSYMFRALTNAQINKYLTEWKHV